MSARTLLAVLVCTAVSGGCAVRAERAAAQAAAAGDRYAASTRYDAAVIEYRNAIKKQPRWAEAHRKLADAYLALGKRDEAYREYATAIDLDSKDVRSRLEAGRLLFGAGLYDEAQVRAEQAIDLDRLNADALVLLARSVAESALSGGNRRDAEDVMRGIVSQVPDSVDARVALADFLARTDRKAEAGDLLKRTLAEHPKDELTNRALASFCLADDHAAEAEAYLRTAAAVEAQKYDSTLALADFYLDAHRLADARTALAHAIGKQTTGATVRLAAIEDETGSPAEARRMLAQVLTKHRSPEALALQAQFLLHDGKADAALTAAYAATDLNPELPAAQYVVGTVSLDHGEYSEAERAFREAMRSPRFSTLAALQLAKTTLAAGRPRDAIEFAEIAGTSADARLVHARALLAAGQSGRAREELTRLETDYPRSATPATLLGTLDFEAGDFAGARARADRALAVAPDSFDALLLAATTAFAAGDPGAAERYAGKAAAQDPSSFDAIAVLAQTAASRGDLHRARTIFEGYAVKYPESAKPRTALGVVLEADGKPSEARRAYEQALALDSGDAVASNNLARLYAADPDRADAAVRLARTAVSKLPDDPETHDTLGWAYYKAGQAKAGASELARALALKPGDAAYTRQLAEVQKAIDATSSEK